MTSLTSNQWNKGARRPGRPYDGAVVDKEGRLVIPAPNLSDAETEARVIATSNLHKPWARRYLRSKRIWR